MEESVNDQIELIRKNAALAIETLGPTSEIDFGLNRDSVEWVEGFIERQRAREDFDINNSERLIDVLGSFLGECIIANAGGEWRCHQENGWGIAFSEGNEAYPFNKVRKAFEKGLAGGDSILSFYAVTIDILATGKLSKHYLYNDEESERILSS